MRLTNVKAVCLAVIFGCSMVLPASAQGQLTPVISVNDRVITQYELTQRRLLLDAFNTPGDLTQQARETLIEDRLKQQELSRFGVSLPPETLDEELEAFASRANLTLDQFLNVLGQRGIDPATLRDYVATGVLWRNFVRSRFNREVTVTEADIDRAIARQGAAPTQIELLLSEIIIPITPQNETRAREVAGRIAQIRSFDEFSRAASQASALPSRENGGRIDWVPASNYPPQIATTLLDLSVGEVTEPIELPNAIALFQKRGQREARRPVTPPASIDYAAYYIPGGQSAAAQQIAANVAAQVDVCDDLYGIAKDQPREVLDRETRAPSEIPGDIALELAQLDPGEISTNLTANNGQTLVFLMLCARNQIAGATTDREAIGNQIRGQRLTALADALIADLRAAADIR
ncbi:periplasmic chaperone for outer membrane proteins SurA [Yoonia litorea]|uniref:Parvulin-like PPIase n=2 Tax=Yoonia litorea TaxID=1123755 RepID=A0A1I6LZW2_9RHOB|nr:periplasmic chaperone for outer membrane proteins SurA [Yoonia litorea]